MKPARSAKQRLVRGAARAMQFPHTPGVPLNGVNHATAAIGGVFGLVLLASSAIVWLIVPQRLGGGRLGLLLLGWTVAGALLLLATCLHLVRVRGYGSMPIVLAPSTPLRGHALSIRIDLRGPLPAGARVVARLRCLDLDFRPMGRNYRVYASERWSEQRPLEMTPDQRSLTCRFVLPENVPSGNVPDHINQAYIDRTAECCGWLLEVFDEARAFPLRGNYRLPVH